MVVDQQHRRQQHRTVVYSWILQSKDSVIRHLHYQAKPTSSGTFQYANGETVTFKVGDVVVGSAAGAATVTPVTLGGPGATSSDQKVLNIASFLQTLDKNGGKGSNIVIPDAAHTSLSTSNPSNSAYVQQLNTTDGFVKDSQTYSTAIHNVLSSTVTSYNPSATVVDTATAKQQMESYLVSKNIPITASSACANFSGNYLTSGTTISHAEHSYCDNPGPFTNLPVTLSQNGCNASISKKNFVNGAQENFSGVATSSKVTLTATYTSSGATTIETLTFDTTNPGKFVGGWNWNNGDCTGEYSGTSIKQ